jgi:tetratricopeptide (TPR) repeat protein
MAAGVYADCSDPARRDPEKAIALIEHAIALSPNPTYLTVLALAYFRSGNLERALATQRQAVESPKLPPGYRDEALRQLRDYESALAAQKH